MTKDGEEKSHDRNDKRQIDENLKRVYDDMFEDEIPERFTDLLRQLREKESGKGGSK